MAKEVTYEQAKDLALSFNEDFNMYLDYPDVFIFYNSKTDGDEDLVIEKSSGEIISHTHWVMNTKLDLEKIKVQAKLVI